WPKAGEYSRQMSQHAVHMVQRNVTPRGDKNGADINLALDALEMAFNRPYINAFVIVGGDSDFIALVEKLKQYDKRVFVVGGRAFTSNIMQRNCHEFISYENLMRGQEPPRQARTSRGHSRVVADIRPLSAALPNVQRALQILEEREVSPQVGLLKSTLIQLDPTFSERDYGAGTFLEFMQKMERAGLVHLRRTERGHLVEAANGEGDSAGATVAPAGEFPLPVEAVAGPVAATEAVPEATASAATTAEAMNLLRKTVSEASQKAPNKPLYLRQISQALRGVGLDYDSRRHGFRAILDLLHEAQREGVLRLHRDHRGTWRVFPLAKAPATAAITAESDDLTSVVSEVISEPAEVTEEAPLTAEALPRPEESGPPMHSEAPELIVDTEPAPPKPKVRKSRPRAGTKGGSRKPAVRRKSNRAASD
ncbi:MAG: NYN domain-containing protein, partial [Acidobacteria bacterium]|nr:NYN domain-containing protein [Acidobacteriota bacterium]